MHRGVPYGLFLKIWLYDSLAGIASSNPCRGEGMDFCVLWLLCVSATGWSFVQRSPSNCGVSEYDREASAVRRPWLPRAVEPWEKHATKWSSTAIIQILLRGPTLTAIFPVGYFK